MAQAMSSSRSAKASSGSIIYMVERDVFRKIHLGKKNLSVSLAEGFNNADPEFG